LRPFAGNLVPKRPWMALCTSEGVNLQSYIMWADFRDTHALYLPKAKRFVGYNRDGFLLIGKSECRMVDGLWLIEEDPELIMRHSEEPAMNLVLQIIS